MRSEVKSTVLVVNDLPDQLEMMRAILDSAGYHVLIASTVGEGFELARRDRPDLVISDVLMPGATGIDLCRLIRAEAEVRTTPIMLVSALRKDTESAVEGLQAGADDYLEAPYDPLLLIAKASRLVERAQSEAYYRDIVEQATDIIYTRDMSGHLLSINIAGTRFLGRSSEELAGLHIAEALQLSSADNLTDIALDELRRKGASRQQAEVKDSAGQSHWLDFSLTLIRDRQGREIGVRGVARDITDRILTEERLQRSFAQLQALSARLQSIREEERTRIALEIHDELGQLLTGLKMDLSLLATKLTEAGGGAPSMLLEKVGSMSQLLDRTVEMVRRIVTELRPGVLDALGLTAAIEWQAQEFQSRTGVACRWELPPEETTLDMERSTAVFRIFQEILTNVARHASATRVRIRLAEIAGELLLEVRDNGRGITEAEINDIWSLGLLGMKERALLLGGKVSISGTPGEGTVITVRVPLS